MKNVKQILVLVLSLGLMLGFFSPLQVKAVENPTITVHNPKDGQTYSLYRVFDLSYNNDLKAYIYTVANNDFENELFTQYPQLDSGKTMKKGGNTFKIIDAQPLIDKGYSKVIGGTSYTYINPYDFSIWLNSFENPDVNFVKHPDTKTGTEVKWENLDLGYYMIKSTAGTVVSLTTTDYQATVYEKNILPSLTKQVKGGSASDFADLAYANIGEELEFKITFDIHNHANTKYVLKDVVPAGIDIITNSLEVKIETENLAVSKYTVNEEFKTQNPVTRELNIEFPLTTIQEIAASLREADKTVDGTKLGTKKTITVTYKGKLNNSAKISNHEEFTNENANRNKAELVYDKHDAQNPLKAEAYADVRTVEFNIFKFAVKKGDGSTTSDTEQPLANAKFKIYTQETDGTALGFQQVTGQQIYNYIGADGDTEITTDGTGTFNIRGLKTGTYYIEETAAPDGFNPLQKRVKLDIAENEAKNGLKYTATIEETSSVLTEGEPAKNSNILKIENKSGPKLPETGGIGRTIIYTIGAILFFGALILLVARKRVREERA